ncbi:pyridoxamine 5'-phosphate oxidase family protein [Streptomyces sp. NBC_01317]|uniref:pyridoxamine 5'-phosphate oxidase family protein n=1 Tax=Streptomyces sp. NBC_01317 TaxID=2903822 RepID=UPI002E0FA54C|nr:pyridoxamine 5'-phosphate oxidase family protein [Streptomyces sp. NBC_01317]WSJ47688.1 pyridoxamine 5'-phosphate oxidase family protein [Streptomyces sp. NBC_01317]
MADKVDSFSELADKFFEYIQDIRYCTMITVDKKSRPRARVLLPIWETVDGRPVGWLAAYKTPVKVAHLANNPHTTYAYWSPRQNAVYVDSVSTWAEDMETKTYAWELYQKGSPPGVGYDPYNFWRGGPADPKYHVLRIDPWRVQVLRGTDLSSRIWTKPEDDKN